MDTRTIIKQLFRISSDSKLIERAVIDVFSQNNNIDVAPLHSLLPSLDALKPHEYKALVKYAYDNISDFTFNVLIEIFEGLIPANTKKKNGAVYTPEYVREYIIDKCLKSDMPSYCVDPSCGCGAFLISIADALHKRFGLSYSEIINEYLFGVDIDEDALCKTKVLLSMLALMNKESKILTFNLICADFLNPDTINALKRINPNGFDCVIGNPPYVRYRNMEDSAKQYFSYWETASSGNIDLYMPFFEAGIATLKQGGRLGYITPNGYLQSVNGKSLRSHLLKAANPIEILDFRDNQLFKGVTSYTCITYIDTNVSDSSIYYFRVADNNLTSTHFSKYETAGLVAGKTWRFTDSNTDEIVYALEHSGKPLSSWKIRNGLATLKNGLYFFTPEKEDSQYYYREYNGEKYKIEKDICIKVAKPNIIKNEDELQEKMERAIFPYKKEGNVFSVISEHELMEDYPQTYAFFKKYRVVLESRDKGHGNYPAWYAYGRTQGMSNFGKKLLIPYIAGSPIAVLSLDPNVLFYCGYALFSENEHELRVLKKFLESEAFWYYIFHTSKPYSKGFMAFAKNYIVRFTIPEITDEEEELLLSNESSEVINRFIWNKYGLPPQKQRGGKNENLHNS